MKIALDMRFKVRSGGSAYVTQLAPRLLEQANGEMQFVIVKYAGQHFEGALSEVPSIEVPKLSAMRELIWMHRVLPKLLSREKVDLYHGMKLFGPANLPCPSVHVAHSITLSHKGRFPLSPGRWVYFALYGTHMYRKSRRVIAVSQFAADFVADRLGVKRERIVVIPNGLDERFRQADAADESFAAKPPGKPYILCVGNIFPVKNHLTAVRAFAAIADQVEHRLVIAGDNRTSEAEAVRALAAEHGLSDRVQLLGFVDVQGLVELYRGASLLVHPSFTEGGGIAVMEAMSQGVPVLASRRGGLPEVGAGAAMFVDDPLDHQGFARAMIEIVADEALQTSMRQKGMQRAATFSWDVGAARTLRVYQACLGVSESEEAQPCRREIAGERQELAVRDVNGGDGNVKGA